MTATTDSPFLPAAPPHWVVNRFGRDIFVSGGQVDPRAEPWSSSILIAPNHIESGTGRLLGLETAAEQGADSGKYLAKAGQVLYSKIRPGLNKVTLAPLDCLCSADMYAIEPRSGVDARYLAYYMRSQPFHAYASVTADRVKMPKINREELAAAPWVRPPLSEQLAIADFLDEQTSRIDTLIGKQTQLITTLRERRSAVVEREIEKEASTTSGQRLKHITREVRQGWSPQCLSWPADGRETWAVLKAGAANAGRFRPEENKELPPEMKPRPETVVLRGDLVVSRANTRDLVGSAAVVNDEYPRLMLCDKLYAFRLDARHAVPTFVALRMGTRALRGMIEVSAGGTSPSMQNISREDLANLPMDLPAVRIQQETLRVIDVQTAGIDALVDKAEQHIALAKERRSALITAAVTGQIDVRTAGRATQGVA